MQEAGTAASGATQTRGGALQWVPPIVGAALLLFATWFAYQWVLNQTRGQFAYALDDAYIHLALAKNIVQHGVWGVTPYQTTAAGSSPLWAILLAGTFLVTGVNDWMPLLLNVLFGVLAVFAFDSIVRRFGIPLSWRIGLSVLLVLGLPYLALALSGMEHLLHVWLLILFAATFLDALREPSRQHALLLFALGFLATLARYESAFLFVAPLYYAWKGKRSDLAMPMVGAVLAVVLFGLYSISVGMPFIPGTMALKGVQGDAQNLDVPIFVAVYLRFVGNSMISIPITLSIIGALAVLWASWTRAPWARAFIAAVAVGFLLHLALSSTRQLFRYEAYLFAMALVAVAVGLAEEKKRRGEGYFELVAFLFGLALLFRGYEAIQRTPQASKNIHDQQVQMARFLKEHYEGGTIALNDIGAVAYYSGVHVVDLFGLASNDVKELKLSGKYDTNAIREILRKRAPDVILVYPEWFNRHGIGGLPRELKEVATWYIPENVIAAFPTVTFYAMPGAEIRLRRALKNYEENLPDGVVVYYDTFPRS